MQETKNQAKARKMFLTTAWHTRRASSYSLAIHLSKAEVPEGKLVIKSGTRSMSQTKIG